MLRSTHGQINADTRDCPHPPSKQNVMHLLYDHRAAESIATHQQSQSRHHAEPVKAVSHQTSLSRPMDAGAWPLRAEGHSSQEQPGDRTTLVMNSERIEQALGHQSSCSSGLTADPALGSSSSSPSPTLPESSYARRGKRRALTLPLLAQKAENISRLDRPSLGPRSPRLCDSFGNATASGTALTTAGSASGQGEIKGVATNWKGKVGHILTTKKSSGHIENVPPTSPYHLVTVSGDSPKEDSRCQLPPFGPKTIQVRRHYVQNGRVIDQRDVSLSNEEPENCCASCDARPLSYDRGVTLMATRARMAASDGRSTEANAPDAKTNSAVLTKTHNVRNSLTHASGSDGEGVENAANVTGALEKQSHGSSAHLTRTPERSSRPSIRPRSSSKQPVSGNGNIICRATVKGAIERQYRSGSTETIRIYDEDEPSYATRGLEEHTITSPSHKNDRSTVPIAKAWSDSKQHDSGSVTQTCETVPGSSSVPAATRRRQAHYATQDASDAGVAISLDASSHDRPSTDASKPAAIGAADGSSPEQAGAGRLPAGPSSDSAHPNYTRKGCMNHMRTATRKIVKQRQQDLAASRATAVQRPPVSANTVNANVGNLSPHAKIAKASLLPVPKRVVEADNRSPMAEAGGREERERHSQIGRLGEQQRSVAPCDQTAIDITENIPSDQCPAKRPISSAGAAMSGYVPPPEIMEDKKPILLSDGYTLKQLSDQSPQHGPQLRVAPDAARVLIGSPTHNRRHSRKMRLPLQDFRKSEPVIAMESMQVTPAKPSCQLPTGKGMTTSQSATCLGSPAKTQGQGSAIAGAFAGNAHPGVPVPPDGRPAKRLSQHKRSKSMPARGVSAATVAKSKAGAHRKSLHGEQSPMNVKQGGVAITSSKPPSSLSRKESQSSATRSPSVLRREASRVGGHTPIREVPSSSSLQSRFYSQSKTTIPLPRNMVQTKYSGESLAREYQALPAATARLASGIPVGIPPSGVVTAVAGGCNSSSRSLIRANPRTHQRLNESVIQRTRDRGLKQSDRERRRSSLATKGSSIGRSVFSNFKGLFSRKSRKVSDLRDVKTSGRPTSRQRAKLVKKQSQPAHNEGQIEQPQLDNQASQRHCGPVSPATSDKVAMTAKPVMNSKRVLSPRVVPWPPSTSGQDSSSELTAAKKEIVHLKRQLSKERHIPPHRELDKNGIPAITNASGVVRSKPQRRASLQSKPKDATQGDTGVARDLSRVSSLTEYTMDLLKAAKRESIEAKKVNMIKLAKILIEAVNHAHEAEKAMLVAAQAARRAELSCAQAQENALRIGEIAREAMQFTRGCEGQFAGSIDSLLALSHEYASGSRS